MNDHQIVSREKWLKARLELLKKEKEHTRARDKLTHERQKMPWVKVEKKYEFDGSNGKESLEDLFGNKSQLIVYHFMFDPDWEEGCKSCSFIADHYNPSVIHIANRDVSMVTISKAPLEKLEAFKKRMGWDFKWLSSFDSDFNHDFHVSFTEEELKGDVFYNYNKQSFPEKEAPGISAFAKNNGEIFHTYSAYGRGLENFMGAYHLLDIIPKGRDEDKLSWTMEWLRHHDRYENDSLIGINKNKE